MPSTALDIRPLGPIIGAEVHGISLHEPLADDTVAVLHDALIKHLVLFFRDQDFQLTSTFGSRATSEHSSFTRSCQACRVTRRSSSLNLTGYTRQAVSGTLISLYWALRPRRACSGPSTFPIRAATRCGQACTPRTMRCPTSSSDSSPISWRFTIFAATWS